MREPPPPPPHRRPPPRVLLAATSSTFCVRSLPRLFHQAGAHVTLLAPARQPLRSSRYVDRFWPTTIGLHAELVGHLARERYDLVVVTDEHTVEHLALMQSPPEPLRSLPPEITRAISSRSAFFTWSPRAASPHPTS